jgi:Domain of unknown function (DUF4037)
MIPSSGEDMPPFIPGMELSRGFFREVIGPIISKWFPSLCYATASIGTGSDGLGFDDEVSRDHEWGPRCYILFKDEDRELTGLLHERLAQGLPREFCGYSVAIRASTGDTVPDRLMVGTLRDFIQKLCALDCREPLDAADWLTIPSQRLLEITSDAVFHDTVGDLTAIRQTLDYYPHDVWLYLLASSWQRISQEEHLMPRAGHVGDELGSALICSRLIHDVMSLCFLMEKRYAPYPKWFGTAFQKLRCAAHLTPILRRAQTAANWHEREDAIGKAYEYAAGMHNSLVITAPLPTALSSAWGRPFTVIHGEAFAEAICQQIANPQVKRLASKRLIGNIDQISDNTDLRMYPSSCRPTLRHLYL